MKTPQQLKITQDEFDSLIAVRDHFANGAVKLSTYEDPVEGVTFNMRRIIRNYRGGIAFDIGGWMKVIELNLTFPDGRYNLKYDQESTIEKFVFNLSHGMKRLNYPYSIADWDKITPLHAARAINNLLVTGFPNWRGVMAVDFDLLDRVHEVIASFPQLQADRHP